MKTNDDMDTTKIRMNALHR